MKDFELGHVSDAKKSPQQTWMHPWSTATPKKMKRRMQKKQEKVSTKATKKSQKGNHVKKSSRRDPNEEENVETGKKRSRKQQASADSPEVPMAKKKKSRGASRSPSPGAEKTEKQGNRKKKGGKANFDRATTSSSTRKSGTATMTLVQPMVLEPHSAQQLAQVLAQALLGLQLAQIPMETEKN